ncbi:hypothetical protein SmJEL517_g00967 [Synchytrium microbalum]|uniref:Cytochrome b5 heme-binding domain-containing protein n=1 Tax=Synchytrium microbalum TaxID=1806994 RepID=A0A507CD69_9FUNG|nr:uncharacterized protein SmJEL517_g00967 [Synchytrium microbalum]TPX37119.1 hypothetical protein SmJEL517_g00967 [Synchytrium microbalum]
MSTAANNRWYSTAEIARHNTEKDCWIIVNGKVFDVTSFLDDHPGGKKILVKVAGTDASKQFAQFHNPSVLESHAAKLLVGEVGEAPAPSAVVPAGKDTSESEEHDGEEQGYFGSLAPFVDPYWYQDWYSPYYNESHRRVRAAARKFTETEIIPNSFTWDESKQIPKDLFVKAAQAGILGCLVGHPLPIDCLPPYPLCGGVKPDEFDAFHEFIICDELSRCGSGGVVWALVGGFGIGLPPVAQFATEEVRKRVVTECMSGHKNICLAITEPYAGSDVAQLKCEAKKTPDGKHYMWVKELVFMFFFYHFFRPYLTNSIVFRNSVNGIKKWITNGVFADYFTVACRTGGAGMGGISLLLIERSFPGVSTRQMQCSGVWASGTAYVTFEDVKVPVENLIGKENKGFKIIMRNFNHERMGIAIQATRFARVCYEDALHHAHKRSTFGKKMIEHPVIRLKLANMSKGIEATHAWMEQLLYQTTKMPEDLQPLRLGGPIALLKAQSTQIFELCAREAAQIFGGLAYTRGGQGERVERLYREVRAYAIPGGSEEIMLDLGIRQSVKVSQVLGAKL